MVLRWTLRRMDVVTERKYDTKKSGTKGPLVEGLTVREHG